MAAGEGYALGGGGGAGNAPDIAVKAPSNGGRAHGVYDRMAETHRGLPPELADYLDSMPAAYARSFTLREASEHAQIVARRAGLIAHAEAWPPESVRPLVCVVADDQPGLLSFVTDALLSHGLNIQSAQVYCRRLADGTFEAVDFFDVAPSNSSCPGEAVEPAELASFAQTLRELIAQDQLAAQQPRERDTIPVPGPRPSRFYFDLDALRRGEYILIVETPDFPGLLFALSSALHGQRMRILASEVRTADGLARDRFTLDGADGEPITAERLWDIQQAVRTAVQVATSRQQ